MKVAVTGASGHVGNCLIRKLIEKGSEVIVLRHDDEDDLKNMEVQIVEGNVLDKDSLNKLCHQADQVFHLAAKISIDEKEKELVYRTNVEGTKNVIAACNEQKIKRLIHFSSIHTLDPFPMGQTLDETRPMIADTHMIYEKSKKEGEKLVLEAAAKGLPAVILTPTAIIGPYDNKPSYLGQALIKIYSNKLPMLIGGGYDWVDVRDVVDGAISASEKGRPGERYILSGKWISLKDLSNMISQISHRKTPSFVAPSFLAHIGLPFIKLYADLKKEHPLYTRDALEILKNSNPFISSRKAQTELGYNPRPIEETLMDTFDYFKTKGFVN